MANKSYKSNTPRIVAGNDFTLSIMIYIPNYEDVETNGRFKPLDLNSCTDISVNLICGKHTTIIPLEFTLAEEDGLILAQVEEYQVHEGSKYGVEVKGKTSDGQDWRWYLAQSEGIYITNNTSQSNMIAGVANRKLDLYARVGFNVPVPEVDLETNHWLVGDIDTGVKATGKDGDSPYVGDNGNWWVGDADTGVLAYREDFVTSNVSDCVIKFVEKVPWDAAQHPNTIYITPEEVDYLHYDEMVGYVRVMLESYLTDASNEEKYLQIADAANTYLTLEDATATYLSKGEANETYLKKTTAANTYLTPTSGDDRYLKLTDAVHTYLTQQDAVETYLTKMAASDTYWSKDTANTIFLKKYEAAETYATKEEVDVIADHIIDPANFVSLTYLTTNYMPSYMVDAFYVKKSDLNANYFTKEQTIELIENYLHDWVPTGTTPTGTTPTGTTPTGTTPTGTTPTGSTPTAHEYHNPTQTTVSEDVTSLHTGDFDDLSSQLAALYTDMTTEDLIAELIADYPTLANVDHLERYVEHTATGVNLFLPEISDIFIPTTLTDIVPATFIIDQYSNTNIIFAGTIPPTLNKRWSEDECGILGDNGNYLSNKEAIVKIYVPDEAVNAYKTMLANKQANDADYVYPLSEYDHVYSPTGWSLPTVTA